MGANRIEHWSADQLGVVVGASLVFARHDVGAQEGGLGGYFGCQRGGQRFGFNRQPVARFDLHGCGARPVCLEEPPIECRSQGLPARGAGGFGGDTDPASVVGFSGHATGELLGAVTGEDQVGVGVDESG